MSMSYVFSILVFLVGLLVILGFIWYVHPFKVMTWFYHGILGWHKPDDGDEYYDGCSFHSRCRFCHKPIMQDSQGNWFTYMDEPKKRRQ